MSVVKVKKKIGLDDKSELLFFFFYGFQTCKPFEGRLLFALIVRAIMAPR